MNTRVREARIEAYRRKFSKPHQQLPSVDYLSAHTAVTLMPKPHYVLHVYFTAPAEVPHDRRMQYAWYYIEGNGWRTGGHRSPIGAYGRATRKIVT